MLTEGEVPGNLKRMKVEDKRGSETREKSPLCFYPETELGLKLVLLFSALWPLVEHWTLELLIVLHVKVHGNISQGDYLHSYDKQQVCMESVHCVINGQNVIVPEL